MNENEEVLLLHEDDKVNNGGKSFQAYQSSVVMTADKYFEAAAAGSKSGSQKVAVLYLYSRQYQWDLTKAFKQAREEVRLKLEAAIELAKQTGKDVAE